MEIVRLLMKDSVETRMRTMLAAKYGTDGAKMGNDSDIKEDSKPRAKKSANNTMVGSVCADKATLLTKEFDTLFNVEPDRKEEKRAAEKPAAEEDDDDDDEMALPDAVGSGTGGPLAGSDGQSGTV